MNKRKLTRPERLMLASGLLLTSATLLLSDFVKLPDFVRGGMEGLGVGIELMVLVKYRRSNNCSTAGKCTNQITV